MKLALEILVCIFLVGLGLTFTLYQQMEFDDWNPHNENNSNLKEAFLYTIQTLWVIEILSLFTAILLLPQVYFMNKTKTV